MPEYRRFIAYFYEYIDGKKQKNAGFAKVELRNGMWRILFRLTTASSPEPPEQVYGFVREKGWLLGFLMGTMQSGNNSMEEWAYRADTAVWEERYRFSDLAGIWIQNGDGRCYVTVWDDEPIQTDRFVLELPKEIQTERIEQKKSGQSLPEEADRDAAYGKMPEKSDGDDAYGKLTEESDESASDGKMMAIQAEAAAAETVQAAAVFENQGICMAGENAGRENAGRENGKMSDGGSAGKKNAAVSAVEAAAGGEAVTISTVEAAAGRESETARTVETAAGRESESVSTVETAAGRESEFVSTVETVAGRESETARTVETAAGREPETARTVETAAGREPEPVSSVETAASEEVSERHHGSSGGSAEQRNSSIEAYIWKELFQRRQRFEPFADSEIGNCIQIMPCDIMRLQQAGWQVGRSSFLQHGFYQYHHLLFGMTENGFVLGVPGVPNAQERYMAQMFGFGTFKTAKWRDGGRQFGYWYRILPRQAAE